MKKDPSSATAQKVKLYILFPIIYVLILVVGLLIRSAN